jgi:hypothetical protein
VETIDRYAPEVRVGQRNRFVGAGAVLILSGLVAGCGSPGKPTIEPLAAAASPTATPAATAPSDQEAILAAYREFFARQAEISAAPKDQRSALLAPFTVDPALDRVLRGMYAAEGFGEVGYGAPVVNPTVTKIDGDTATVNDCQDTRGAGTKKLSTGKVASHGVKAAKVVATAKRGADGAWRLSFIDYPNQPC